MGAVEPIAGSPGRPDSPSLPSSTHHDSLLATAEVQPRSRARSLREKIQPRITRCLRHETALRRLQCDRAGNRLRAATS